MSSQTKEDLFQAESVVDLFEKVVKEGSMRSKSGTGSVLVSSAPSYDFAFFGNVIAQRSNSFRFSLFEIAEVKVETGNRYRLAVAFALLT